MSKKKKEEIGDYTDELPMEKNSFEDEYPCNHQRRGKAIIFNNSTFLDNLRLCDRMGSETDVRRLQNELMELGFDVDISNDFKYDQIKKKLEIVARENHDDADCLLIVVMSYGRQIKLHHNMSTLQIAACDKFYDDRELFKPFERNGCPSLTSKPKIFYIQACKAVSMVNGSYDKDEVPLGKNNKMGRFEMFTNPKSSDFLVCYSTAGSTASVKDGSYFIQALCDELEYNRSSSEDLLDLESLLINVKRNVSVRVHQMPVVYSTLIRKLYLKPEYSN